MLTQQSKLKDTIKRCFQQQTVDDRIPNLDNVQSLQELKGILRVAMEEHIEAMALEFTMDIRTMSLSASSIQAKTSISDKIQYQSERLEKLTQVQNSIIYKYDSNARYLRVQNPVSMKPTKKFLKRDLFITPLSYNSSRAYSLTSDNSLSRGINSQLREPIQGFSKINSTSQNRRALTTAVMEVHIQRSIIETQYDEQKTDTKSDLEERKKKKRQKKRTSQLQDPNQETKQQKVKVEEKRGDEIKEFDERLESEHLKYKNDVKVKPRISDEWVKKIQNLYVKRIKALKQS